MEIVPYQSCDRAFLNQLLIKTAVGDQQLGYPRLHSCEELEKEYLSYPDSPLRSSIYLLTENTERAGVLGFLRDGAYAVLWGPITLRPEDYEVAIRASVSFAKKALPNGFHVFVHNANAAYRAALAQLGGKLRSTQHVMRLDWSKSAPLPPKDKNVMEVSSKQLAVSPKLRDCTRDLLAEGFPRLDSANELVEELLRENCRFLYYMVGGTALGVLVADDNFLDEVRIEYLAVSNTHRRLGIATKLLQSLLQSVYDTHGLYNINLTHDDDNLAAHSLYRKNGFVDDVLYREFIVHYQMPK